MKNEAMEEEIREIVSHYLRVAKSGVHSKAKFIEDLSADSLATIEIIMALEKKFNVEITDEEARTIQTIDTAVDLINQKVQTTVKKRVSKCPSAKDQHCHGEKPKSPKEATWGQIRHSGVST